MNLSRRVKSYFADSYQIRILLAALIAVVVADGVITKFLVHNGFAKEGNPFLYLWVHNDAFLVLKLLGGLIAAMYLWGIYKRNKKLSLGFSSVFLTGYTFIIFWNVFIVVLAL